MTRFKGSLRSATAATTSSLSATGIWTLAEQIQAKQAAVWPNAGVGGSILLNGSNQYLSANATQKPTTLGNNLFTIEAFVRFTNLPGSLASLCCTSDNNFRFFIHSTGVLSVWNGSTLAWLTSSAPITTTNTWYHVCAMRSNTGATTTVLDIYVNGVRLAKGTDTTTSVTYTSSGMLIGAEIGNYYIDGNITNFRIVNGTAVYPVAGFTPPTTPLSNITNTQLLLLASESGTLTTDSSTANAGGPYTVTNVNGAIYSALNPF